MYKIVSLGLLLLFVITGCLPQEPEQTLSFETLENAQIINNYWEARSAIFVVTNMAEVENLSQTVFMGASTRVERLRQIQFDKFIVVLIAYGKVGSSGYKVTVQTVTKQGNRINLRAEFIRPDPFKNPVVQMDSSPFHLLKIPKSEISGRKINFVLWNGSQSVASLDWFIP